MWLQSQKQMGESGSMWTPHHRRVLGESKLTTDEWVSV